MSKPAYVKEFRFGDLAVTSLVVDPDEFDEILTEILGLVNAATGMRVDQNQLGNIRKAKHIPLIGRGDLTESLFAKYGVRTDKMAVIVRGAGDEVLRFYGKDHDH